ncbi:undecaprenyl diphosphate synthase family protein [Streptomyces malaysiensis subsp. malaysiensis]
MFEVGAWRVPSVKRLLRASVAEAPAVVRQRRGPQDGTPGRPRHLAIIMDGNGRWAALRGLSRTRGHQAGVLALPRVVDTALEEGIEHLSLFFFSTENWNRPRGEVAALMRLTAQLADVFRGYGERGCGCAGWARRPGSPGPPWPRCAGRRTRHATTAP